MKQAEKSRRNKNISSRSSFWLGLAVVALAFATGAALTWRRWPDLIIDFGPQLYMPWRIAEGAVLYRDIFYFSGGPLSQYLHAALFRLSGVSFLTIIVSNLAVAAAMLLVLFRAFSKASNVPTGTGIALTVVASFAFAQYTGIGNNNYLAPYSHEILHGLALSVLAVTLLAHWAESGKISAILCAGGCAGLVLLTKPDIFMALSLTSAAAFALAVKIKPDRHFIVKSAAGYILAATLPAAGFFLLFLRTESWPESLRLEFFSWRALASNGVLNNPFYQWSLGLDAPFAHLRQSAIHFLTTAVTVLLCAGLFGKSRKLPVPARWALTAAVLAGLLFVAAKINWLDTGASLPLLCLVAGGLLLCQFQGGARNQAVIFPFLWAVFAVLLLAKQGVFPRIWHTGFALAMPAFTCAAYLLLWLLPEWCEGRHQVPSRPMRLAAAAVLTVACVCLAQESARFYAAKNLAVGHGRDVIFASGPEGNALEARNMNLALDWIEKNVPPQATLAAIPQGAMLNYLSRRVNPSPCLDWNPTVLAVFGSSAMAAALTNRPPDYIALVEWQTYEFGTGYFGSAGYGEEVMQWVRKHYQPAALFGSDPLRNGLFGIKILKLEPAAAGTTRGEMPSGAKTGTMHSSPNAQ